MVLQLNACAFIATILAVWSPLESASMDWRDRTVENIDLEEPHDEVNKMKCMGSLPGSCKANRELPESLINYFSKRKSMFSNVPALPHRCSCQMVNQLMSLGRSYYPRFLENWVCKNDSCGSHHRCVEKKYSVKVLKLKDYGDADAEPMCISTNFKGSWVPETVSVGVACECVPALW